MKKHLLSATAIALAISAGSALAADSPPPVGPPVYVPPLWTGFYTGFNFGWSWGNDNQVNSATIDSEGATPFGAASALSGTGVANVPMGGPIGGGQIGYNHQFINNNLVIGVEADIQGAGVSGNGGFLGVGLAGRAFTFTPFADTVTVVAHEKTLDFIGTVRGRVGYLATPTLLVYGTGGLAYGGVTATTHIAGEWGGIGLFTIPGVGQFSDTLVGWTAGTGGECMFAPNLSVKAEYVYYDLGSATWNTPWGVAASGRPALWNITTSHTHFDGHIVRAGLNYHFYWGGGPY